MFEERLRHDRVLRLAIPLRAGYGYTERFETKEYDLYLLSHLFVVYYLLYLRLIC